MGQAGFCKETSDQNFLDSMANVYLWGQRIEYQEIRFEETGSACDDSVDCMQSQATSTLSLDRYFADGQVVLAPTKMNKHLQLRQEHRFRNGLQVCICMMVGVASSNER